MCARCIFGRLVVCSPSTTLLSQAMGVRRSPSCLCVGFSQGALATCRLADSLLDHLRERLLERRGSQGCDVGAPVPV